MDSYIVRIYRRDEGKNIPMHGLVEMVGAVGQEAFGTKEELWNILSFAKWSKGRGKKLDPMQQKKQDNRV